MSIKAFIATVLRLSFLSSPDLLGLMSPAALSVSVIFKTAFFKLIITRLFRESGVSVSKLVVLKFLYFLDDFIRWFMEIFIILNWLTDCCFLSHPVLNRLRQFQDFLCIKGNVDLFDWEQHQLRGQEYDFATYTHRGKGTGCPVESK